MGFNKEELNNFPIQPGVYLMKGVGGRVLYVGKAKNLKQRIRNYFLEGGDGRLMVPFLRAKVETIDTVVVFSEKEALLLENNLIKQHKPKYNALLKDDKSYIALKINNKAKWPMVSLLRHKGVQKPDGLYFGPYPSAHAARQTLDLIQRLFPLRQCSDQEFSKRTRPCILYEMKRCAAPCVNLCTKDEYHKILNKTIRFLQGDDVEVLGDLKKEMSEAAEMLEFERAAKILETVKNIEKTLEQQLVDKAYGIDMDAIAIFRESDEVILTLLTFRKGKLTGCNHFDFKNILEDDEALLSSFILQHYRLGIDLPKEILLPLKIEDSGALEEILSFDKERPSLSIYTPKIGEKKKFIDMAYLNAEAAFKKEKDVKTLREKVLLELQEKLHLSHFPLRIECIDSSHLSGTSMVSSLVAFSDGVKDTSRYRKYKIRQQTEGDDYGAMREVLERRYQKGKLENNLPDLLMVDGGKGHLNVALSVLSSLGIVSIDVIGFAKEDSRHDRGATCELVYVENIKDPFVFKKNSPLLFFLQQIRDEAHRTAIAYNRHLLVKKNLSSVLDEIEGIGPGKRKILLKYFGSLKRVLEAKESELSEVKGLSKENITKILEFSKTQEKKA